MIVALPFLLPLVLLFMALALAAANHYVVRGVHIPILSFLEKFTILGPAIRLGDELVHFLGRHVANWMAAAIRDIDAYMGLTFTTLGLWIEDAGASIALAAQSSWNIAKLLVEGATTADLGRVHRSLERLVRGVEHAATQAIARVTQLEKSVAHSVVQGVYPRLRTLEHEVARTIPREIRTTRSLAREAEATAERAWKVIRAHPWTAVTSTFVGAVAIALSRLGLDWIKCNSARSFFNKAGCGFWKLLEDALGILAGLALAIFSVLKPQQLAQAAVDAVDVVEPILADILKN